MKALSFNIEDLLARSTVAGPVPIGSPEFTRTRKKRADGAGTMIDLEDNGLGMSPSLPGANSEAIPKNEQMARPGPVDTKLRFANLSRQDRMELVLANPTEGPIQLEWNTPPTQEIVRMGKNIATHEGA
jgi:hypothetical protein